MRCSSSVIFIMFQSTLCVNYFMFLLQSNLIQTNLRACKLKFESVGFSFGRHCQFCGIASNDYHPLPMCLKYCTLG